MFIMTMCDETKFEVDTTSDTIILSYLYRLGNVSKKLFRYC